MQEEEEEDDEEEYDEEEGQTTHWRGCIFHTVLSTPISHSLIKGAHRCKLYASTTMSWLCDTVMTSNSEVGAWGGRKAKHDEKHKRQIHGRLGHEQFMVRTRTRTIHGRNEPFPE